jgi:hypothetical protein
MEKDIKAILRHKRVFEAQSQMLRKHMKDDRYKISPDTIKKLRDTEDQLSRISNWLQILTEDEAFVVQRHLVDGIDLPRVTREYEERWGKDLSKSNRTMKSYQRRALQKIMRFEKENLTFTE